MYVYQEYAQEQSSISLRNPGNYQIGGQQGEKLSSRKWLKAMEGLSIVSSRINFLASGEGISQTRSGGFAAYEGRGTLN